MECVTVIFELLFWSRRHGQSKIYEPRGNMLTIVYAESSIPATCELISGVVSWEFGNGRKVFFM